LPLLYVLGLLYSASAMIGYVTKEKELRQKELMKMMSVTESDIGWSWFCTFFGFYFLVAILVAVVSTQLYGNSELAYLLIFWILTFLSIVVFTLFLSSLTSKSTRGTLIGLLVFFMGVFLIDIVNFKDGSARIISLISIHPVAAFSYGILEIGRLEDQGLGLQSNTVDKTDNPSGYTFNTCIMSLIFDCILWGIVTWYLNRVIKADYGQALPLWFPFTRSYWFPASVQPPTVTTEPDDEVAAAGSPFEPVSDVLKKQGAEGKNIEIHRLRKTFGEKTAVDGLSLSMYSGQITALLGHNGAGYVENEVSSKLITRSLLFAHLCMFVSTSLVKPPRSTC
jgi:ATP-binding cassette subfamily A (ABC1) protein 3